jgi:flagellar basal-body rod protein FlgF
MIYGLYLSATGVLANTYRQDVIANNLANIETVGFKRDLAPFRQRLTESQSRQLDPKQRSNPDLEMLGGGLALAPTSTDFSQGELDSSSNPLDLGLQGPGFFAVQHNGQVMLTRDGRMMVDREGRLTLASGQGQVLDNQRRPITLAPNQPASIAPNGDITQGGKPVGRVGVFDVANLQTLRKQGGMLFACPNPDRTLRPSDSEVRSGAVERSNAEPSRELISLLDAQRQIEANANMIRYQDQTLARLVNDVGKIG